MNYKLLEFQQMGDDRGHLVVLEEFKDVPFEIKRIFYIYGSDQSVVRGKHANRNSEFILINVSGTSKILIDDGKTQEVVELNKPHTGVYISNMIWKEMFDFSSESVLLVLSSHVYDKTEYIRGYDEFVKECRNG